MDYALAAIGGYSLTHMLVAAVLIAGCVGIVLVAAKASGIAVPQWVIAILWIVGICVVAVAAIKFLASLM